MTLFQLVVFSILHLFLDPSSVSSMPFPAELVLERESKVYYQRERECFFLHYATRFKFVESCDVFHLKKIRTLER